MYICRHCGLEYKTDEAVVCPRCQAPKGKGNNFCPFCGEQVTAEQKICMNCGVEMAYYGQVGVKSKIVAGLLGIFLGTYGVHNFYLGYTKKAIVQLTAVIAAYIVNFISLFSNLAGDFMMISHYDILGALSTIALLAIVLVGIRIWTFVEAILILCGKIDRDGKGRLLK